MKITVGTWIVCQGRESPGRVETMQGSILWVSFLGEPNEDGTGSLEDEQIVFSREITEVITDKKEVTKLNAEVGGG